MVISGRHDDPDLFGLVIGAALVLLFVWFKHHVTDPLTIAL
jgi:hypothetical protein